MRELETWPSISMNFVNPAWSNSGEKRYLAAKVNGRTELYLINGYASPLSPPAPLFWFATENRKHE